MIFVIALLVAGINFAFNTFLKGIHFHETKLNNIFYVKYQESLKGAIKYYSKDDMILITATDFFYMDITLNFCFSSLFKFNITNYIFGCTFDKACQELKRRNIK